MIQGRELRELRVALRQIAFAVGSQFSRAVGLRFVYRDDLAVSDVGDCVGAAEDSERGAHRGIKLEIARHVERVPERTVFRSKAVEAKPATVRRAHLAQLI